MLSSADLQPGHVVVAISGHTASSPSQRLRRPSLPSYFSFTKSKTKIAHTPTVTGNCTNCASCTGPPRGTAKVSRNIATAVSVPSASLVFVFIDGFSLAKLAGSMMLAKAEKRNTTGVPQLPHGYWENRLVPGLTRDQSRQGTAGGAARWGAIAHRPGPRKGTETRLNSA